jgi:hypothetical protein
LFVYLYDQLETLEDLDGQASADGEGTSWIKCTDEPDKRVFYKQENGCAYGSIITDNIIETNLAFPVACFDNFEIMDKLMPEFYDLKWLKKITDVKGMMYGK